MTKAQKKQLVIVAILLLLSFYYAYKYNNRLDSDSGDSGDSGDGLLTDSECWARPLIECWTGCNPSFRPPNSPPESSMFHAITCGVQDECSNTLDYPNSQAPPCASPEEEADNDFVVGFDTGDSDDTNGALSDDLVVGNGLGTYGCMDSTALNYDPNAGASDGSCYWTIANDNNYSNCCNPQSGAYNPLCNVDPSCNCMYNC